MGQFILGLNNYIQQLVMGPLSVSGFTAIGKSHFKFPIMQCERPPQPESAGNPQVVCSVVLVLHTIEY